MRRKTNQIRTIDSHIGRQLKAFRTKRGMTQKELGTKLGISHQQLYKYENGSNSLSSGMLYDVARILDVLPSAFFDGLADALDEGSYPVTPSLDRRVTSSNEHLVLMNKLNAVRPEQRVAILGLLRSMLVEEMSA